MPGYSYISLSGLLTQLAERLDDPSNIYWTQAELTLYIQETLRTWQSVTGYWRGRFAFNTTASTIFYDLTAQASTLIPYTVKDTDLNTLMAYHMIEKPPTAGAWNGTDMFSLDDFTKAQERRRNQFLVETGMVLTRPAVLPWPAPPTPQASLPDNTIDIRRAAWINAGGQYSTLWRSNEFAATAFGPGWNLSPSDPPGMYSIAAEPPVTLQLIPPPLNPGSVELLIVQAGAPLNPAAGVLLGVPDNLAWVVKWGAMADLLSKAGQAQDLQRAAYCEQRYQEGIQFARIHTSVIQSMLNGVILEANAVESMDAYTPGWQNTAPGKPTAIGLASWNMLALSGPPDAGPYSITLDVVQNAPVPVLAGDQIQIGREELDVQLDYAQHLAMFKTGGNDFLSTTPFYDRFLRLAGVYNERLRAAVDYLQPMSDRAYRDEILIPRRVPVEQTQAQGGS